MLSRLRTLEVVEVDIDDAVGLVTATEVTAPEAVPPFDNTAVDGFAVRASEIQDVPTELRVVATVAAGVPPEVPLGPRECARIMTGAVIPGDADSVVMVEDTEMVGPDTVRVLAAGETGRHVRRRGDDLGAGDVALAAGTVLRPAHVGLLATVGRPTVTVFRRPVVGVVSTGDELVGPEVPLQPGQIRDSNRQMLLALCRAAGFVAVDLGLVPDDEARIEAALRSAADTCDAVVTSGGVSMGDFDYVKAVLGRIGEMEWMQVAIKPAKPLAFGTIGGTPVFGLPGNPVSSLVSFELFARPGLNTMAGYPDPHPRRLQAMVPEGLDRRSDGKTHFVRVLLDSTDEGLVAHTSGGQGSHQLAASAGADGLAVLGDGPGVGPGSRVDVIPLR